MKMSPKSINVHLAIYLNKCVKVGNISEKQISDIHIGTYFYSKV